MNYPKENEIGERTFEFGVRIVKMVLSFPKNVAGDVLGKQIIRSGTSIGANISEAQSAISKKEFIYQMNIAKREAKETLFWLRVIAKSGLVTEDRLIDLLDECNQIVAILVTIIKKSQNKVS